eukprot:872239-Pyramimonas_sp.AAC.1
MPCLLLATTPLGGKGISPPTHFVLEEGQNFRSKLHKKSNTVLKQLDMIQKRGQGPRMARKGPLGVLIYGMVRKTKPKIIPFQLLEA